MKKLLILLLCLTTLPVLAKPITPSTEIEWNGAVVMAAAREVILGYKDGSSCSYDQIYWHVLYELLDYGTFSVETAVSVCANWANRPLMSTYEDCFMGSDICEEFGMALIRHNNMGTDSIYEGDGFYSDIGRIYTKDKKYYVDNDMDTVFIKHTHINEDLRNVETRKCNVSVFEAETNKKVAVCNSGEDDGFGGYKYFNGISPDYDGYIFRMYCDYNVTKNVNTNSCSLEALNDGTYREFYVNKYKACADALTKLNFNDVGNIISSGVFSSGMITQLNNIYEARNFIRDNSANETTTELYDDLYYTYNKYCRPLEFVQNFEISNYVENLKKSVDKARDLFGDTKRYKNTQVKSLEEAKQLIADDLSRAMIFAPAALDCTGTCNKIPGTQDDVTCKMGNLSATFEFDDICEGKYKDNIKNAIQSVGNVGYSPSDYKDIGEFYR